MRILIGPAAVALSASVLAAQSVAPGTPTTPANVPLPTDPVPQLSAILADSNATAAQRDEAASELVAHAAAHSPAAIDTLLRGLSGGHDQELATAHAIAGSADPNPEWIGPLIRLLGSERLLHDAACRALARFGDNMTARDALINFSRDTRRAPQERAAAEAALGSFVDKTAAEALLVILTNPREPAAVTAAAGDALGELTGITDFDDGPDQWRKWMDAHGALPPEQWKAQVYPGLVAHLQREVQRQKPLEPEIDSLLYDQYLAAPDAQKNVLVMRYLNSSVPEVRAIGAETVRKALQQGLPFPPESRDRLTSLVGDSDPSVRLQAAEALQSLGYAPALNALIQQLVIEKHTNVKIALLSAIGPLDDPRALPEVLKMLHDPSIDVAIAAAQTIRQLADTLYKSNPDLAVQTAEELWRTSQEKENAKVLRAAEFKAAAIEAMAPLKDYHQSTEFPKLLNISQPAPIRAAALHALRDLANKNTSDAIANWLSSEPNPALRADAIDALGTTGDFVDDAKVLHDHTQPANEPDPTVRAKAWLVWEGLLGDCTDINSLNDWQHNLSVAGDWEHDIFVLIQLNANLQKQHRLGDLAISEQALGEAYMQVGRPDQAATHFQNAWNYWVSQGGPNLNTTQLVNFLTKALLQSKQYYKAVQFGQDAIKYNPQDQQTVGSDIRDAADVLLHRNPATRDDAEKLINLALHMTPPLPQEYQQELTAFQREAPGH
ncbi:MAG TPA: hypothetical protein VHY37_08610 [Tepidisphaeraceae bacterium]|jgi:HEAT repeat protein|nr:hypothetical protein [Tepidisphaeraceae bacterium]